VLAPDERAILRTEMRPDPGYELDIAVATTFTLDLTAALVAPLAFAAFDLAESADPVAVLEAVRSATDRVDVFCQAGQIRVPSTPSDLMAFLEPMVHEVQAPIAGFLFHPKVWVLRYRGPDGPRFRLLCGTRNLTDDVSWDAVVRLDGVSAGGRRQSGNRPLVDFVKALPDMAVQPVDEARRQRIDDLAESLATVEWEAPVARSSVAFHVLGLHRRRGTPPLVAAMRGSRHLVISPFLDDRGLASITEGSKEVTVVSRPEELEGLSPATLESLSACRIVNPMAGLSQPDEEGADGDDNGPTAHDARGGVLGGLHAKTYVVERAKQSRLFVGSANATAAGLHGGNVEVVVEIQSGRKHLGIDLFTGADADMAKILEPYEPTGGAEEPVDEQIGRELENLLRRVAAHPFTATVVADGTRWREVVTADAPVDSPAGTRLTVGLLTRQGTVHDIGDDGEVMAAFDEMPIADITPFVVVRASRTEGSLSVERATVVRAALVGDPPGRFDEVIARQVDTPEKFLRFLTLLLGLGEGAFAFAGAGVGDTGGAWSILAGRGPGMFELLVRAVADRPQALTDLDRLVQRLEATERGRAVLPAGFGELWSTVRAAQAQLVEAGR
jgi:hypothetical protein